MEDGLHYMPDEFRRLEPFTGVTAAGDVSGRARVLMKVLDDKSVRTVYQPIVSLTDGQTVGYEALSRVTMDIGFGLDIAQMFRVANVMKKTRELDELCWEKAVQGAAELDRSKKLFLNVCPNVISDKSFKNKFAAEFLGGNGLNPNDIVFEITEHNAVADSGAFLKSVEDYRYQNYRIAIDDVGAGFSGLNMIAKVKPDFIKIDMNLIRHIDKDEIKQHLCKSMADFSKSAGVKLVAEGIETENELKTLIRLKFDYGQGFFLSPPQENCAYGIPQRKIDLIGKYNMKYCGENSEHSLYPIIGNLSAAEEICLPDENADAVYKRLMANPTITSFTVVQDDAVLGFMTRTALIEVLGGRYGYWLHSKRRIRHLMSTNFLKVNYNMPIDQVSRLAMQRPNNRLYNPIVVEKDSKYLGTVTIKDLLDAHTKIEVEAAVQRNPLTKLPGNVMIEKEIKNRLFDGKPYCMIYIDVDNFKAYNDAYGFENGDLMLTLVADIIKECATRDEFVGHIGGDDFIIICDYHDGEDYCLEVLYKFFSRVRALYRKEDLDNGCITSINRNGVVEEFPIASLSIAAITNRTRNYKSLDEFSKSVATLKKKCKMHVGNYYDIQ
jgi:diguanylate cyclase (GGDEF)-like protein